MQRSEEEVEPDSPEGQVGEEAEVQAVVGLRAVGVIPAKDREDTCKDEEGDERADAEEGKRQEEPRCFECVDVVV